MADKRVFFILECAQHAVIFYSNRPIICENFNLGMCNYFLFFFIKANDNGEKKQRFGGQVIIAQDESDTV